MNMMKHTYQAPQMELLRLQDTDIIRTSPEVDSDGNMWTPWV